MSQYLQSFSGDQVLYREVFEQLAREVTFAEAVVVSTLPRGGLGIVQPAKVSDGLLRAYAKGISAEDKPAWAAILQQRAIRATDVYGSDAYVESAYVCEWLRPAGLEYALVAPVGDPVLAGYCGAMVLLRSAEQGDFNDADLATASTFATKLGGAARRARAAREGNHCDSPTWAHRLHEQHLIFDGRANLVNRDGLKEVDAGLAESIRHYVAEKIKKINGEPTVGERVQVRDSRGDLWVFRGVLNTNYPALGAGPFVFLCHQPDACDFRMLRGVDLPADPELARLFPAIRFIQQEFSRGPKLEETAEIVHLSPFHFHRRFTELLGFTPKALLLECQIYDAKSKLMAKEQDLAAIAASCGFAHQSHFTSRFKQATGMTPTRWRKMASELGSGNGRTHGKA